jgi:hypothetical protein
MADLSLPEAVKKFAGDLAKKLDTFVKDISTLEVKTYTTSSDPAAATVENTPGVNEVLRQGKPVLRAYSKVSFDGDTETLVPVQTAGEIDRALWEVHAEIVKQAMLNRTSTITAITAAARNALRALQSVSGQ